jgi:hypothetical protein
VNDKDFFVIRSGCGTVSFRVYWSIIYHWTCDQCHLVSNILTKHVIDSTELISLVNGSNGFNVLPSFNYQVGPLPSIISQIVLPILDRYFHLGRPVNTRSTIKFAKLISLTFSECFLSSSVSAAESEIKGQRCNCAILRNYTHPPHQHRLVHISRP